MSSGTSQAQARMDVSWKNSLRPLDPGILSDVKNKKKERFGLANITKR